MKTAAVLGALVAWVALATAFAIHGSSIGVWNQLLRERPPDDGVLLGSPRWIRRDEYAVTTPAMLSQARTRPPFASENPAWGAAEVPLIFSLPARHWSMAFRPQLAGFLALDLERGFAFYWAMKGFLLVAGVFLLLLQLTRNDFGASLLGAAWVFFSGFVQWWYSSPAMLPETVGCVALLLVAAHALAFAKRRLAIAFAALVFALCLVDASLSLYPPFQAPLLHLGLAIGAGSLVPRLIAEPPRDLVAARVTCALVALGVSGAALAAFYADANAAIRLMLDTAYPGARTSTGGGVSWVRIFSGFFGPFMSDGHYPKQWLNVCEASNFVLLFPVPLAAILVRGWRRQPVSALEWSLCAYLVLVVSWLAVGWPAGLALVTGFGLSPGTRSLLGLGLGSIVLCCVFLAQRRVDEPQQLRARVAVFVALAAALALYGVAFDRETGGFASAAQIAGASGIGAAAGYALLARRRALFALLVLVPEIWSHGLVNPVARGLAPILDTRLHRTVSAIVAQDPDARWAVYGDYTDADLIKTTGARVLNGTKVVPPLDDLHVLDPSGSALAIYNRYAHVSLDLPGGPGVAFRLRQPDTYVIEIDPRSELLRALGVRYVALPLEVRDPEFLAVTALVTTLPDAGLWVYQYRSAR